MSIIGYPTAQALGAVVKKIPYNPKYIGNTILPDGQQFAEDLQWTIYGPLGGMTKPHNVDAEPRGVKFPIIEEKKLKTEYWKDVTVFSESDILYIKRLGTWNQRAGMELITERLRQMNARLDTRIEWCRWQALSGELQIIDEEIQKYRVINYEIPQENYMNAGWPWDDYDNADIISDLQAVCARFRGTGAGRPHIYMNAFTAKFMAQNKAIRELVKQSTSVLQIGQDNIGELVMQLVGGISGIHVYDEGYILETGDFNSFIRDYVVICIAQGPPGERLGEFVSTISLHNGTIDNPQPGKFVIVKDRLANEFNPSYALGVGIYGLPLIYHPEWIVILFVKP